MKAFMLIRPNSEAERAAREFLHDFEKQTGKTLEVINADSPEGAQLAQLYDATNFPAVLAVADDGSLLQSWQGGQLPRISEVSFYTPGK